jgi:hypothetical protein
VDLQLQPDWQRALGQFVEVRRHAEIVRTGMVDDVMPDNSILWVSADGPFHRQMYERAEGFQVFARYPWDPPPLPECTKLQPEGNDIRKDCRTPLPSRTSSDARPTISFGGKTSAALWDYVSASPATALAWRPNLVNVPSARHVLSLSGVGRKTVHRSKRSYSSATI